MDSSSPNNVAHQRSNQDPLKCPRCNSYNTKFCYYNNYSLSQPRHFCKACKRYWTRGGTLRNVPVGGGCRKNKKAKPQPFNGGGGGGGDGDGISSAAASTATIKSSSAQPDTDLSPTSNRINNPLLFSQPTNPLELNFPFSRFPTTRVSSDSTRFDHQSQIYNGLGIGFSSSQIQDDINPMFFGSSNFATAPMTTSTMASLLASSLQQQRFPASGVKEIQGTNDFPGLMPSEDDMQMLVGNGEIGKESITEVENRSQWNSSHIEQINSSSDYSSSLFWNTNNNVGAWFDPSNMGSSVPSLI